MNAVAQSLMLGLVALSGPPETVDVQGRDLGARLRVIGSLGLPLGERIRIRGEWYRPKGKLPLKDPSPLLRVTEVNGKPLEEEVIFPAPFVVPAPQTERLKPRPGDSWEVEGYEVGGFMGTPDWALTEIYGDVVPATGVHMSGFKFILEFVYITGGVKESPNSR
jgi:hypothetical protein